MAVAGLALFGAVYLAIYQRVRATARGIRRNRQRNLRDESGMFL